MWIYFKLILESFIFLSRILVELLLCFLGVAKEFELSSLLMTVSTWFMGISFNTSEGWLRAIIESPQSLVLSFFGEVVEYGGTKNVVLGGG